MAFLTGFKEAFVGESNSLGWKRIQIADNATVTTGAQDTGIVGLQWARVRARCKTIGTLVAADIITMSLIVGTGAAVTAPEGAGQCVYTVSASGETTFNMPDIFAWSQNGFQSFKVDFRVSAAHTGTFDIQVDVL